MQVTEWVQSTYVNELHTTESLAATAPRHLRGLWQRSCASESAAPQGGLHVIDVNYVFPATGGRGTPRLEAFVKHPPRPVVGPCRPLWELDLQTRGDTIGETAALDAIGKRAVDICGVPCRGHTCACEVLTPNGAICMSVSEAAACALDERAPWQLGRSNTASVAAHTATAPRTTPPRRRGRRKRAPASTACDGDGTQLSAEDSGTGLDLLIEGISMRPHGSAAQPGDEVRASAAPCSPSQAQAATPSSPAVHRVCSGSLPPHSSTDDDTAAVAVAAEDAVRDEELVLPESWSQVAKCVHARHKLAPFDVDGQIPLEGEEPAVLFELSLGCKHAIDALLVATLWPVARVEMYTRFRPP